MRHGCSEGGPPKSLWRRVDCIGVASVNRGVRFFCSFFFSFFFFANGRTPQPGGKGAHLRVSRGRPGQVLGGGGVARQTRGLSDGPTGMTGRGVASPFFADFCFARKSTAFDTPSGRLPQPGGRGAAL
jgi:hypothetical protein